MDFKFEEYLKILEKRGINPADIPSDILEQVYQEWESLSEEQKDLIITSFGDMPK